jgi:hypothetical protein
MEHGALHAVMVIIAICALPSLVHPSNSTGTLHPCHSLALTSWIPVHSQTGPRAVLSLFLPTQVHLSFVDLAIALHHPGQSSLDTTSNPRPLARGPSLIALLLLTFALFAVPSLHVSLMESHCPVSFLALPFQFCPTYWSILLHSSHSMSCPPPALRFRYAAMLSGAACGYFVHGYFFPAHIRRIRIIIALGTSYPPSPSCLSVPTSSACCVAGLDSLLVDANPVESPLFLFILSSPPRPVSLSGLHCG